MTKGKRNYTCNNFFAIFVEEFQLHATWNNFFCMHVLIEDFRSKIFSISVHARSIFLCMQEGTPILKLWKILKLCGYEFGIFCGYKFGIESSYEVICGYVGTLLLFQFTLSI